MYIFLEAGIGVGALVSGWVYGNNPANFQWVFIVSAGMAFLAFFYLMLIKKDHYQSKEPE